MYNITVVFTRHKEYGTCNSSELHNIIEQISPDIIFEELSCSIFNESYNQGRLITLETNAIKKYLENHEVRHIPVDTYQLPTNYHEDLGHMYDKLFSREMAHESQTLRNLLDKQNELAFFNGFHFLNSNENLNFFDECNSPVDAHL